MERKKQVNPVTNRYYSEKEFVIGATVFLVGFKFMLARADEYTEKYMEDNPDQFPEASMDRIILKIKKLSKNYGSLQEYACDLLKKLDKNDDGVIDFAEFTQGLRA